MPARKVLVPVCLAACCFAFANSASAAKRGALPDLAPAVEPLNQYHFSNEGGRRLLRFPTVIANTGAGPAEIIGRRKKTRGRMNAYQTFYDRKGRRVRKRRIGAFHYHGAHSHWHLLSVARYRLLHLDGTPAAQGTKVSFCFRDNTPTDPRLPGAPFLPRYGDCSTDKRARRLLAGISRGWADVYASHLFGQSIDVTGVPPGSYLLECTVDPDGLLEEQTRANNTARVPVSVP